GGGVAGWAGLGRAGGGSKSTPSGWRGTVGSSAAVTTGPGAHASAVTLANAALTAPARQVEVIDDESTTTRCAAPRRGQSSRKTGLPRASTARAPRPDRTKE